MTLTNQNFKVYRGDSATIQVALSQADGTAYDPTLNAELEWKLGKSTHAEGEEILVTKSRADGNIRIVAGGVEIDLSSVDTDLDPRLYYHEMKVRDGDDVATSMTGVANLKHALRGFSGAQGSSVIVLRGHAPTVT